MTTNQSKGEKLKTIDIPLGVTKNRITFDGLKAAVANLLGVDVYAVVCNGNDTVFDYVMYAKARKSDAEKLKAFAAGYLAAKS